MEKVILSRIVVGMMHSDALRCNGFTYEHTPYARYLEQRLKEHGIFGFL